MNSMPVENEWEPFSIEQVQDELSKMKSKSSEGAGQ